MEAGRIVILNGTLSSGKSTVARAISDTAIEPFLTLGIDDFVHALPAAYRDLPSSLLEIRNDMLVRQGFFVRLPQASESESPWPILDCGPIGERAVRGMHRAVAELAACGNSVILEHMFLKSHWFAHCRKTLENFRTLVVKICCSELELDRRELRRADRLQGLAHGVEDCIHNLVRYDLEISSDELQPAESALLILSRFRELEATGITHHAE